MGEKIPTPVLIGIAVVVIGIMAFFGMRTLQATDPGVPQELAEMQAEAEARRSPGYGKDPQTGQQAPAPPIQPGFSPGRTPEGGY